MQPSDVNTLGLVTLYQLRESTDISTEESLGVWTKTEQKGLDTRVVVLGFFVWTPPNQTYPDLQEGPGEPTMLIGV